MKYSGRTAEGVRGNSGERSSSEFTTASPPDFLAIANTYKPEKPFVLIIYIDMDTLIPNDFTSIFSEKTTTELMNGGTAMMISYIPFLMFGIVLMILGYYEYMYPDDYRKIVGSVLLYFHLGKNNELHSTEIPENSNTYSILSILGIKNALAS